ncbi:MAG: MATE family efflux transporter [Candidatus Methanoplasma sp.]|nr:MATE family efflux transporter [Candidatus Methanoplasma sp.]
MSGKAESKGVETMLGDPRKALVAFSIPIAIALFVQQVNVLVDSFWVTSLGGDAMAAIGLLYPIYAILIGIGNGLGIGASAAIARKIGGGRRGEASRIAGQSLVLAAIVSVAATPFLLAAEDPLLRLIGAGATLETSKAYAFPLFLSTALILMSGVVSGMLRGEGAMRRSMQIQVAAAAINLVLDPIFIYTLGWGIAGAAWVTSISMAASVAMGLYWYCIRKSTFVAIARRDLRVSAAHMREILSVGLPQSLEFSVMNAFNVGYNFCVIMVGSTDLMGLYTVSWRILMLLMIPAQAMGGAIVSACSAEFGMKRYDMIRRAYLYATRASVAVLFALAAATALVAGYIAEAFTAPSGMTDLRDNMTVMLRILLILAPFFAPVYVGSSLLQALNRSKVALASSALRNGVLTVLFFSAAYLAGTETSLWWAMVAGEVFGGALMGYWAYVVLMDTARKDGRTLSGRSKRGRRRAIGK